MGAHHQMEDGMPVTAEQIARYRSYDRSKAEHERHAQRGQPGTSRGKTSSRGQQSRGKKKAPPRSHAVVSSSSSSERCSDSSNSESSPTPPTVRRQAKPWVEDQTAVEGMLKSMGVDEEKQRVKEERRAEKHRQKEERRWS